MTKNLTTTNGKKRDNMIDRYASLDMNNKLIWNLRDIGHTLRHISEGKGSQKRILIILREEEGITQSQLTERLRIQPGSVSEAIGKLEAAGFLLRTPNEIDRRTTNLFLTAAGQTAAVEAYEQRQERHHQMFVALSEEEKSILLQLLEKVNTDWDGKYRRNNTEFAFPDCHRGYGHHHRRQHGKE